MNSQEVRVFKRKSENWRAVRYLLIALALGGWFMAGTAFARTPDKDHASKTPASTAASKASGSSASTAAQQTPSAGDLAMPTGMDVGNYHVQSSIELGWRYSNITGNQQNYDTFVNMQQGPRLLNFAINAHSLNHEGALFDSLSLNGFGFGGDPDDVVRLRMSKNKLYNFNATYRRDKYYWNYTPFANPYNSVNNSPGAVPNYTITYSPHALDLSRRMTSLNLTLKPQSAVRFRLGYNHELLKGPSLSTNHVGTEAQLYQAWNNTTDNYNAGVDFLILPRTMLSYDQFVEHFKQDTAFSDMYPMPTLFGQNNNFGNQVLVGGTPTPVDLGLTSSSCTVDTSTTPPTAPGTCDGYLSYSRQPLSRVNIPTERFSFHSTYFTNLAMTGMFSYSAGKNTMPNYTEIYSGYEGSRTHMVGTNTVGNGNAREIMVNGNWGAAYQFTSKLRATETLRYNRYSLPGVYNFNVNSYFSQAVEGDVVGMNLPAATFNATNCPAPFTADTCPQHASSSAADVSQGYNFRFLAQEMLTNTIDLEYNFSPKAGASIGYRYLNRDIHDADGAYYTSEIYYPGGYGADRGNCGDVGPVTNDDGDTVGTCTANADGTRVYKGFDPGSDTEHELMANISGHSALFGLWIRPASNFRTSFNADIYSANASLTRITPRQIRHYQINSTYRPTQWAEITQTLDIVDSSDNVTEVQDKEHNRSFGVSGTLTPSSRFSFDLSYNYNDIYTQAFVCFNSSNGTGVSLPGACGLVNVDGDLSELNTGALSLYQSKSQFASADIMVKPVKQVTLTAGYAGSFVRGTTAFVSSVLGQSVSANFLNTNTPWGPLRFNYQLPYLRLNWQIHAGLSYIAAWNYYGYNNRPGYPDPLPLGTQDFNGNNMTLSVRYSF